MDDAAQTPHRERWSEFASAAPSEALAEKLKEQQQFEHDRLHLLRLVHSHIVDYRKTDPSTVSKTLETLQKVIGNVLAHPSEQKYREVCIIVF